MNILGYTIVETLHISTRTRIFRMTRNTDGQAVVVKLLNYEHPSSMQLARFQHEFDITCTLANVSGVIHYDSLIKTNNTLAIVMENIAAQPLDKVMQQTPLTLSAVLDIMCRFIEILTAIHQQGIIHKDIKPQNILWQPETNTMRVIDFDIATTLSRENTYIDALEQLEGTLAYMSPEQTGRINRAVSFASDLYSSGCLLFELLTGQLPFTQQDPLELVHSHIAKRPPQITELNSTLPPILAAIVTKLLAKNAEDRYQSAHGLLNDLRRCRDTISPQQLIPEFSLATADYTTDFIIPQTLIGRDAELQTLHTAFNSILAGQSAVVLIAGASGIGKSALTAEIRQTIIENHSYFIQGKFDQYGRDVPYAPLFAAFRDLIEQVLSEPEARIQHWQSTWQMALGNNAQIMIDVLPELQIIIGSQPAVPELGAQESRNRFNHCFTQFVHACATTEHPLVLFLDDLQWIDSASLDILAELLDKATETALLLIGAYRDNEVSAASPLLNLFNRLHNAKHLQVDILQLKELQLADTQRLVTATFKQPATQLSDLAQLVHDKTAGNPFFIQQFLTSLYEQHYVVFEHSTQMWQWDIDAIHNLTVSDNVVDLVIAKFDTLSPSARTIIKLAACLGNEFSLSMLKLLVADTQLSLPSAMWELLKADLLLPLDANYKFLLTDACLLTQGDGDTSDAHFRFQHDRIQSAAHSLLSQAEQDNAHLQIGQYLWHTLDKEQSEARIFELCDHLNFVLQRLDTAERLALAELNLRAARKAKNANAYTYALTHIDTAFNVLPSADWQAQHTLLFALHLLQAECLHLDGQHDAAAQAFALPLAKAKTPQEWVEVNERKIHFYADIGEFQQAYLTGREALKRFRVNIPAQFVPPWLLADLATAKVALWGKKPQDLINLPDCSDERAYYAMRLLGTVLKSAYQIRPELCVHNAIKAVNLSLKYGNIADNAVAYLVFGSIFLGSVLGNKKAGYDFGQLALSILDKYQAQKLRSEVLFVFSYFANSYTQHASTSEQLMRLAYQIGLDVGDLFHVACSACTLIENQFIQGRPLVEIETEGRQLQRFMVQIHNREAAGAIEATLYACAVLQASVNMAEFDMSHFEQTLDSFTSQHFAHFHYVNQMRVLLVLERYTEAFAYAQRSATYLKYSIGMLHTAEHDFLYALIVAVLIEQQDKSVHSTIRVLRQRHKRLARWAVRCPMNFAHKSQLVAAELARLQGKISQAATLYEQAKTNAAQHGYINDVALANEFAARFYQQQANDFVAKHYATEARYIYNQWGAHAKVALLETTFHLHLQVSPSSLHNTTLSSDSTQSSNAVTISVPLATVSSNSSSQWLDLNSIMKAAQILSGEIVLECLLEKMMRIVIENAGAEKGFLLLPQGEQWFIQAEGHINQAAIDVLQATQVQEGVDLPIALVAYVARSQQSLVLNHACAEGILVRDTYIQQHQIKSVLGLPLINQEQLCGILYLENNLTTAAFNSERLETLNLLSAQIAISLQNAQLYAAIQTKERTLTQFLEAVPVGIGILDQTGRVYFINKTGQQWLGQGVIDETDAQSLSQTYQLYRADSDTLYPNEQLPIVRALQGQHARIDDLEIRHPKRTIPIEAWGTPIYDAEGNLLYAITTFLDISERRQAEANKLRLVQEQEAKNTALRYSAEIQTKNTELAATLQQLRETQNQLVEAEKMASLGNLVAGVAHEINTPVGIGVTAVTQLDSLTLDFVKRYKDGKMARSDLEQYLNAVHQTSGLILKNLTRAAELTKSFKSVAVDQSSDEQRTFMLCDYIDEIITSLKPKLDNTGYHINIECEPGLQLTTHPGALAQILTNLIMNSLQHGFVGRNQGHIHITTQLNEQSIQIKYCDDGKGIASDAIEKIYEPFFTTDRAGGGSGLGMHIVYNLITHKLRGSIHCESELDKGVCFTLTIPLSIAR